MLKPRLNIDTLTTDADAVARIAPADHLFTLMSRSLVVPAGWVALATRGRQDPLLVRAGQRYEDDETLDVLFVRDTPIPCVADESALRSADGHECTGSIRLSVRVIAEPAELSAFRKAVIGSSDAVSIADLQRYMHWPMGKVLTALAAPAVLRLPLTPPPAGSRCSTALSWTGTLRPALHCR